MFDPSLDGRAAGFEARSRWAFPVSLLTHAMGIGVLVVFSLMLSVSIKEQPPSIIFAGLAPLPPPPPAPPAGPAAAHAPRQAERLTKESEEIVQPDEIEQDLQIVDESTSEDPGSDAGMLGGTPGGDPLGVPGGASDGAPGGIPDGLPGGVGHAATGPRIVTPEMTPPVLKRKLEPVYPEPARESRLQGRVILQAVISTTGQVEEVTVLRSSNPLFDEAAIEAVRQWRYEPARQDGRPVAVYFTIDVSFSLH